ncbi:MAG: hypothetical protein WA326_03010 [Nitrososphaeraceae archaeon]
MKKMLQSLYLVIGAANPFKLLNRRTIDELVHVLEEILYNNLFVSEIIKSSSHLNFDHSSLIIGYRSTI